MKTIGFSFILPSALALTGCRDLFKPPSVLGCEEAAEAFNECSSVSPSIQAPSSYNSLIAAYACDGQPDCLADYFNCIGSAFSSTDCSTEEGSTEAMERALECTLPEDDPAVCPIDEYLLPEECGGTPPVVEQVTCSYPGIEFSPSEQLDLPVLNLLIQTSDMDGDLGQYILEILVDPTIDGVLSPEARDYMVSGETSVRECDTVGTDIELDFYIKGGFPNYATEYEWYFTVEDLSGLKSDQYMTLCHTPDQEGNPP